MRSKRIYPAVAVLFLALAALIVFRFIRKEHQNAFVFQGLQDRKGPLAQAPEWASVRTAATRLLHTLRENPKNSKAALELAALFIQEARVTGDYRYYDRAALVQLNQVLRQDPDNFQALTYRALIQLSQHHFAEALATAERAKGINPYHAFIYGLLVDAHVELGHYLEAVEQAGKMMALRPDLRSYARVAYLREIHGDYPGAIEAMTLAVDAGLPGEETTEWARVQLGQLYEKTGNFPLAEAQYTTALNNRPSYAYALAGLAHLAKARKSYATAMAYVLQASAMVNDLTFQEELIELYRLSGQQSKVDSLAERVIQDMTKNAADALADETLGHYSDRELANLYLSVDQVDQALPYAVAEYNRRPQNIEVNELLAWVYYRKGDFRKAIRYIAEALRTHCKNPTLLCRAGLIYARAGNPGKARWFLEEGLKNKPYMDAALEQQSRMLLQQTRKEGQY
jgi:tetratricopeptide (TPR) repeat protein